MDTISFMKEAGILTTRAMRQVGQLIDRLDTLTPVQLVDFTLMYASSDMQSAMDIQAHESRLENALLSHSDKFSPENFATLCSVVAFDDVEGASNS